MGNCRRGHRIDPTDQRIGVEPLEPRCLLSGFTGEEVYFAELVNRARMDPDAESARLGFDLTTGLNADELQRYGPVEPLALDVSLVSAARAHSLDMLARGFFDHVNPDGLNPTQRARAAGYSGVAGETIGAGHSNAERAYEAWMATIENRVTLLSIFTDFNESFHYDHIGPGFAADDVDDDDHYTALFGDPGAGSTSWLLGVVFDDQDGNSFYGVGEGAGGVRIEVASDADPESVVATYTTDDAGNYQIELGAGSWIVSFVEIETGASVQKTVSTGSENVKLDTLLAELEPPPSDDDDDGGDDGSGGNDDDGGNDSEDDDHADDGDYANASFIEMNGEGVGSTSGAIQPESDTDLFYFASTFAGELTVALEALDGTLAAELTLRDVNGLPLAIQAAAEAGDTVTLQWNVPADTQFFLAVGSAAQGTVGTYAVGVAIVEPGGGEDGSDDGSDGGGGDDGSEDDGGSGGGSDDDGDADPGDEDPPVDATSDGSGTFTIVRTDESGRPIVYIQQPDGSWLSVDLLAEAGGPTPEGRFSTFVDPDTGSSSIISATSSGLAIYSQTAGGGWQVRNLTAELGAAPIESKPVTFESRTGLVFAAGLDADGNLVTYRHTGGSDADGRRGWEFVDITSSDLAAQGITMPALRGGTLIAYVTAWNGLTLAGLDDDGNVQAAWWAPGLERWTMSNLSTVTGAPRYEGTISAYLTPWKGINIAGTDENGDLAVVWWVPSFGGEWRLARLNQMFDGPQLTEGTIASWVTPWGGLNVSGVTADGDVVVYWWSPTSGGWKITTLSDYITGVDPPARGVIGHTSQQGEISIMGLSDAGDLIRYWWEPGAAWNGENLGAG